MRVPRCKRERFTTLCVWMLLAGASPVHAVTVGLGVFGGENMPLSQQDNDPGPQWGIRVPVNATAKLSFEPYFSLADGSRHEETFGGTTYDRDGFDVLSYGAIAAWGHLGLGSGFPVYPFVGLGSYRLAREGTTARTELGYSFGVGYAYALPVGFALQVRSEYVHVPTDETSRRSVNLNLGVQFRFHPVP